MIRVELPKVTLHLLFFVSNDLWMFRAGAVLFLFHYFFNFFSGDIFNCSEEIYESFLTQELRPGKVF